MRSLPVFISVRHSFHRRCIIGTYIGTGPLSDSPSWLFRPFGQPASSLPPLNEVIDVLALPRAGIQPTISTTLPTAIADISTIYCSHGFSSLTPIIPLSQSFPPISLYAPVHPSEYPGVVFYFVIGYRKYSPGCNKSATTVVMAL